MRKWIVYIVIAALVLGGGGWLIMKRQSAQSAGSDQPTETATVQRGDLILSVEASGSLTPRVEVSLAFTAGGRVADVLVVRGQTVQAGDLLVRLDEAALRKKLEQAELDLQSLTSPYAIAEAEKVLADARDALEDAKYDNRVQQEGYRGSDSDIDGLKAELILAEEKVEDKQEAFDEVADKPEDDYQRAVAQAGLSAAIDARDAVARNLNWYLGHTTELDQAILDADVAIAEARVAAAEALLAELKGETVPQDEGLYLDPALTRLRGARISVEIARLAIAETRLVAPFAGTITSLDVQVGEFVSPGQTVIVLSELAALQAEINLDETDVARIAIGGTVVITVDAFPGAELSGKVTDIAPSASIQSGVVLYPVTVRLDPTDLPLRPGMTANVTIIVEKRENTLIVPFRAVETEGGQAFVTLQTDAGSQRVPVTLGLITDTQIEILSGVDEGDLVAVYANPVQDSSLQMTGPFGGGK
jgi:HlyD family secretion protein